MYGRKRTRSAHDWWAEDEGGDFMSTGSRMLQVAGFGGHAAMYGGTQQDRMREHSIDVRDDSHPFNPRKLIRMDASGMDPFSPPSLGRFSSVRATNIPVSGFTKPYTQTWDRETHFQEFSGRTEGALIGAMDADLAAMQTDGMRTFSPTGEDLPAIEGSGQVFGSARSNQRGKLVVMSRPLRPEENMVQDLGHGDLMMVRMDEEYNQASSGYNELERTSAVSFPDLVTAITYHRLRAMMANPAPYVDIWQMTMVRRNDEDQYVLVDSNGSDESTTDNTKKKDAMSYYRPLGFLEAYWEVDAGFTVLTVVHDGQMEIRNPVGHMFPGIYMWLVPFKITDHTENMTAGKEKNAAEIQTVVMWPTEDVVRQMMEDESFNAERIERIASTGEMEPAIVKKYTQYDYGSGMPIVAPANMMRSFMKFNFDGGVIDLGRAQLLGQVMWMADSPLVTPERITDTFNQLAVGHDAGYTTMFPRRVTLNVHPMCGMYGALLGQKVLASCGHAANEAIY